MINAEQKEIIEELKAILKKKRVTYKSLAEKTDIPESSLKKIFAGSDCSFSRLVQICQALDISLLELAANITSKKEEPNFSFTIEQEEFFKDHLEYYLFFHKIYRDNQSLLMAQETLGISDKKMWQILKKLEAFKLIEVHPGYRVKFKVSGGIIFLKEGPLQERILENVVTAFARFLVQGDMISQPVDSPILKLNFGKITIDTYNKILKDLHEFHQEKSNLAMHDRRFHDESELIDVTWLFGLANVHGLDIASNLKK